MLSAKISPLHTNDAMCYGKGVGGAWSTVLNRVKSTRSIEIISKQVCFYVLYKKTSSIRAHAHMGSCIFISLID